MKRRINILIFVLSLVVLSLWIAQVVVNVAEAEPEAKPVVSVTGRLEVLEQKVEDLELTVSNLESCVNYILSDAFKNQIIDVICSEDPNCFDR